MRPPQVDLMQLIAHDLRPPVGRFLVLELLIQMRQPPPVQAFRFRHRPYFALLRLCHRCLYSTLRDDASATFLASQTFIRD